MGRTVERGPVASRPTCEHLFALAHLATVAVYEVTFVYPRHSYEAHRRFLASLAFSTNPNGIDGFRRHGSGVALTFVVHEEDRERATARSHASEPQGSGPAMYRP